MFPKVALLAFSFLAVVYGQQVGTSTAEVHPSLTWKKCTTAGGCVTQASGAVTVDANWRWLHNVGGYTNCYTGNTWNANLCPDGATCATNCALEGASYSSTYGITTNDDALTLKFVTQSSQKNVGSRVYLMADENKYEVFQLLNKEFTFDVDVSNLPCGLNGALYFTEMDADGGLSKYSGNKAGAKYGTGYCDAQCARDLKFIGGEANVAGWTPSTSDSNSGTGNWGACCHEMDIWEANSISAAFTPHPCTKDGLFRCTGIDCHVGDRYGGVCDADGCDFNSYRMGAKDFFGPGKTVDSTKKMTVVTQFITDDNTSTGTLKEIRRVYVQDGKVIQNSKVNVPGLSTEYDSLTDQVCTDQKTIFGDTDDFSKKGGLAAIGKSLARGGVLVMSTWDDHDANMLWLDSSYPTTKNSSAPGVARGTCSTDSGVPAAVEAASPNSSVTFSNIRFGDIGSTFSGTSSGSSSSAAASSTKVTSSAAASSIKVSSTSASSTKASSSSTKVSSTTSTSTKASTTSTSSTTKVSTTSTTTSSASGATQSPWGQCGGNNWTGPTACATGYTCTKNNEWYSQCV